MSKDVDVFKSVAPWDPRGRRPVNEDTELPKLPGVKEKTPYGSKAVRKKKGER